MEKKKRVEAWSEVIERADDELEDKDDEIVVQIDNIELCKGSILVARRGGVAGELGGDPLRAGG